MTEATPEGGDLIHIRAAKVGGTERIEPDIWYSLDEDGEFIKS